MIGFLFPINSTSMFVVLGFVIAVVCVPTAHDLRALLSRLSIFNPTVTIRLAPDFLARALSTLHWLTLTIFCLCSAYKWDMRRW
jgi:hypothetical protein